MGLTEMHFLVGNIGLRKLFFGYRAVSLTLARGHPSLNLLVYGHCGPNSMSPLITMHSPHPFGNWTLNFGEKVLSNRRQGPFSVIPVHWRLNGRNTKEMRRRSTNTSSRVFERQSRCGYSHPEACMYVWHWMIVRKSCIDIHVCMGFPVRLLGEAAMVFIYQKKFRI